MQREELTVVDNFLPQNIYDYLVENKDNFEYVYMDEWEPGQDKHEATLPLDISEQIKVAYEEKVKPPVGFWRCSIVRCLPGYYYPLHGDADGKIQSTVVYLHPEEGDATRFKDLDGTIEWRPNRLVTWENKKQVHDYRNTKDVPRYTINIYQQTTNTIWKVARNKKPSK
jgi:hypothetical protein